MSFFFISILASLNLNAVGASWSAPPIVKEPDRSYIVNARCAANLVPAHIFEGAVREGQRRRAFWNTLSYFIQRVGFHPPESRTIQVLHLGCGRAGDAGVIASFFTNGKFGEYPDDTIKILGIDIDPQKIERAIRNNERVDFSTTIPRYFLPSIYQFSVGDASQLSSMEGVPKNADIIIMRHEQISSDESSMGVWHRIILQAMSRLSPNGIIIATSYSDVEANLFLKATKSLGGTVLIHATNPYAVPLSHPEVSQDRVVTIFKK